MKLITIKENFSKKESTDDALLMFEKKIKINKTQKNQLSKFFYFNFFNIIVI